MSKILESTKEKLIYKAAIAAKKSIAEPNRWGWPPECIGVFYQGKRPHSLRKGDNLSEYEDKE